MTDPALVNFAPALHLLLLVALLALLPLSIVWLRGRGDARRAGTGARLASLTAMTLFLTFDLIVFGAFTRLTDSGLGCPDWPGCYGHASPLGASAQIAAAQETAPAGPVTLGKAWIEMIHRYLAMTVGLLILVMAGVSWLERRRLPHSSGWAWATLAWVVVQGLFGKYTVTLKLYPAVVTLHLLGGLLLLLLLAEQHASFHNRRLALRSSTRRLVGATLAAVFAQSALGAWVSTNYAVLACPDVPMCQGRWWPAMDFGNGFTLLRELGQTAAGTYLPYEALVAIHFVHRLGALVLAALLVALIVRLRGERSGAAARSAMLLAALLLAQIASGLANVVLGWPLAAALAHSAGAAGLVLVLSLLLARSRPLPVAAAAPAGAAAAA